MKTLDDIVKLFPIGSEGSIDLEKDETDTIRNLAKMSKEVVRVLDEIANIESKDIFQSRDLAKAVLKRYRSNGLI